MTKQEEIQRYLEDVLNKAWRLGKEGKGIDLTKEAKASMNQLSLWGVVLKVGEISDDIAETAAQGETRTAYKVGISWERNVHMYRIFKEAGYEAVEPLIKEV